MRVPTVYSCIYLTHTTESLLLYAFGGIGGTPLYPYLYRGKLIFSIKNFFSFFEFFLDFHKRFDKPLHIAIDFFVSYK